MALSVQRDLQEGVKTAPKTPGTPVGSPDDLMDPFAEEGGQIGRGIGLSKRDVGERGGQLPGGETPKVAWNRLKEEFNSLPSVQEVYTPALFRNLAFAGKIVRTKEQKDEELKKYWYGLYDRVSKIQTAAGEMKVQAGAEYEKFIQQISNYLYYLGMTQRSLGIP
jgi:hypothetical protein